MIDLYVHNAQEGAKKTLELLTQHSLPPTPENYSIWYHYVMGSNAEIVREINAILANKLVFSEDTSHYLYNKYINTSVTQRKIDDAANDTQKVLQAVSHMVQDFAGETKSYSKGVDEALTDISKNLEEGNVKNIVQGLMETTKALKERGEQMNKKLEESQGEISQLRRNLQQVTLESQRDFLTGTYNRKTFEKFFEEYEGAAKQDNTELCMIIIDVDHFKQFNDKYGHLIGDEVLKIVARSLTDSLKGRDIVARFGGEEFLVLLPDTPIDIAARVADNIRQTISAKELKRKDTGENYGTITVSMGIARYRHMADTLPTLMKRADDALYRSKREGRNRVNKES
jgi:diguanylate cyclase